LFLFEPKLITLVVIWLLYGTGIFVKPIIGWDIKHMAYLFIFLFVFITILIVLMTFFSLSLIPNKHSSLIFK
jgi:hypothetical protein